MNVEEIRNYCLQKENSDEGFPFDDSSLVFKVNQKIFLILFLNSHPAFFNVKTLPEWSEELRENHPKITAGYHMNKKHWNSVFFEDLDKDLVLKLIDHSYDLVSKKKS